MSVAVLDFENLSRDTSDAYLAEGVAEEVSSRLGQLQRLTVISRSAVRRLPNAGSMPMADVGRALNVTYVVTGTVRRSGGRVRIGVDLLRAASGVQSWTGQFDRGEGDLIATQEQIAGSVATAIAGTLLPQERRALSAGAATTGPAYEAFLQGLAALHRPVTSSGRSDALGHFRRAVALDSTFVRAWARLGISAALAHDLGGPADDTLIVEARRAAERAIRLAPQSPEGHVAAGMVAYRGAYDYVTALREFAIAEQLAPNAEGLHSARATIYKRQGRPAESIAERARAIALDPLNPLELSEMVIVLQFNRRFDEADPYLDRQAALTPDDPQVQNFRFGGLTGRGRVEQALDMLRALSIDSMVKVLEPWELRAFMPRLPQGRDTAGIRRLALAVAHDTSRASGANSVWTPVRHAWVWSSIAQAAGLPDLSAQMRDTLRAYVDRLPAPRTWWDFATRAMMLSGADRHEDALRAISEAFSLQSTVDVIASANLRKIEAEVLLRAGQADAALERYERLIAEPSWLSVTELRLDPLFAPLHGNPRYERLIAGR